MIPEPRPDNALPTDSVRAGTLPRMHTLDVDALLAALASDDEDARFEALDEIEALDAVPEDAVAALLPLIASEDVDVAAAVIELFARSRVAQAADALLARVASERNEAPRRLLRWPFHAAIAALVVCAPSDPRVLAMLVDNLASIPTVELKQSTIRALMVLGRDDERARAALVALAESSDEWERVQARWALFGIDDDADAHVPALLAALASKSRGESVRGAALLALRDIGEPALAALDVAAKEKSAAGRAARDLAAMIRANTHPVDAKLSVRAARDGA